MGSLQRSTALYIYVYMYIYENIHIYTYIYICIHWDKRPCMVTIQYMLPQHGEYGVFCARIDCWDIYCLHNCVPDKLHDKLHGEICQSDWPIYQHFCQFQILTKLYVLQGDGKHTHQYKYKPRRLLHQAAIWNNVAMTALLLANNADNNARDFSVSCVQAWGFLAAIWPW